MIPINTQLPIAVGFVDSRQGGRAENQDTCGYADTPLGLLVVVCDGMGGGPSGKAASSTATDVIIQTVRSGKLSDSPLTVLQQAIKMANQALISEIQKKPALRGMGTTVTALLINEYSAIAAYVGDSRIYQFRRGHKKFRTFDHSMVFEMVRNGTINEEQARLSEQSNMITKALGANSDIEADIVELPYEKGDRFMLCTDGIWGMFPERKLIDIVAGTSSLGGAVESIVIRVDEEGIANGGKHDNLTVALIETNSNSILKEKMSTKIRNILFALIFICCVSIAGNIIQGFYLPGQAVASSKSEELDIEALQKVWSEKLQAEFDEKLRKSEQEQKRTIDSLSQIITNNPGKAKEYMEVIINQYDIIERLDDIINNLQELRDVSEGKEKEQKLKETVAMVQKLEPELKKKYGISENEFNGKEKILTIGRDESCNIVLSDSTVSRRHAILKIHATGKMEIISMGQNGTFVNGVKLKSDTAYPVTRKDVVSFAHVRQLDWNQIPDVQRYYRYGIMAVIGLAVIITVIVVIQDMKDDTPRLPVIECQQEEKVLPEKEVAPQAEVKKKQDSLSEKKEKNEVSSCFFPKKKTKDKKEENKKNGDKKENDSASKKEQAVPIIY